MIKIRHFDILFIRHIFFFINQLFKIFKDAKPYYSSTRNKILTLIYTLIVEPYIEFFKSKITKTKKQTFKFKISENLSVYGYSLMPNVNIDTIDFIEFKKNDNELLTFHKLNFDIAKKFAEKNGFHDLAKDYFKNDTMNFVIDSWSSKPSEHAFGTSMWHQDRPGKENFKIFIYLNDVDLNTGPHKYAVGSHKPRTSRFLPLFRYSDKAVKKYYNEIVFTGEKGKCFAVDTRGLHRGTPSKHTRVILSFLYYTGPILWEERNIRIKI